MKYEKTEEAGFWTGRGDKPTVVGDFLGRMPAVQMLNPKKGEHILDAGCGAGFTSRMIAHSGASVVGIDRSDDMLAAAQEHEVEQRLSIQFLKGDISEHIPCQNETFDAVSCIAVLMHSSPKEVPRFFKEAYRILKPGGRLLISITHPELYVHTKNFKPEENEWVRHDVLGKPQQGGNQLYHEYYRDNQGRIFESDVWNHPVQFLRDNILTTGFELIREQSTFITQEALYAAKQKGRSNYPAFLQVLAQKLLNGGGD